MENTLGKQHRRYYRENGQNPIVIFIYMCWFGSNNFTCA